MSTWTVAKHEVTRIEKHYNADTLDLVKLGNYQVVARSGSFAIGDHVVFMPEKSVLPDNIAEPFRNYLAGPDKNRVKAVRLRGEISEGVTIAIPNLPSWVAEVPAGECIADRLGISKYEPPVPVSMAGEVAFFEFTSKHDVEQFGIYRADFIDGEQVIVTEKIHGTQINAEMRLDKKLHISSKGLASKGLELVESDQNLYWQAARNVELEHLMSVMTSPFIINRSIQVLGEVIPAQAFKYGQTKPTIRIFDVRVDGMSIAFDEVDERLRDLWVPVLYRGPFDESAIRPLATGAETISGTNAHIREGIVVRPAVDRRASDGTRLMVKIINQKYKETGDELS